jgi:hypothetical protein
VPADQLVARPPPVPKAVQIPKRAQSVFVAATRPVAGVRASSAEAGALYALPAAVGPGHDRNLLSAPLKLGHSASPQKHAAPRGKAIKGSVWLCSRPEGAEVRLLPSPLAESCGRLAAGERVSAQQMQDSWLLHQQGWTLTSEGDVVQLARVTADSNLNPLLSVSPLRLNFNTGSELAAGKAGGVGEATGVPATRRLADRDDQRSVVAFLGGWLGRRPDREALVAQGVLAWT